MASAASAWRGRGVIVVFAALSNTLGDGNRFGGIAFFVWALALLALIGLGVRSLAARGRS